MATNKGPRLCLLYRRQLRAANRTGIPLIDRKTVSTCAPMLAIYEVKPISQLGPGDDDRFQAALQSMDRAHGQKLSSLTAGLTRAERDWAERLAVATWNIRPPPISPDQHGSNKVYQVQVTAPPVKKRGSIHSCSWFIPHEVYRERLRVTTVLRSSKEVRLVLRMQLLQCQTTKDIQRVVATAVQRSFSIEELSNLYEPIMRALYRSRLKNDDRTILITLTGIIARLRVAGVAVDKHLIRLGLKFAARSRDLHYMKIYLRAMRTEQLPMAADLFRSVIAKCSVGHLGLGEIRNGRWRKSDLLQILTGFDDCRHLPPDEQFHLQTWLQRDQWPFMHGWLAALARCRDRARLSYEWELWKKADDRVNPKRLQTWRSKFVHDITSKTRGDRWFVEQMCISGHLDLAWAMVRESDSAFKDYKMSVRYALLDGVEYAGSAWDDEVRQGLVEKYDHELAKIEKEFGVAWVSTGIDDGAEGYHILIADQEEVLDRLGSENWKFTEDYGYPYDEMPGASLTEERSLHDATSTTPAAKR